MSRDMSSRAAADEVRATISGTLVAMLGEMAYSSISVRLLARRANVSRSTFYRHFDTKDDALLYYAQLQYRRCFSDELGAAGADRREGRAAFLRKRLAFVRDHAGYFRALWQNGLLDQAFERLDLDMADVLSGGAASVSPYARAVFAGASAATIKCWIQRGFRENDEELAALLARVEDCVSDPA